MKPLAWSFGLSTSTCCAHQAALKRIEIYVLIVLSRPIRCCVILSLAKLGIRMTMRAVPQSSSLLADPYGNTKSKRNPWNYVFIANGKICLVDHKDQSDLNVKPSVFSKWSHMWMEVFQEVFAHIRECHIITVWPFLDYRLIVSQTAISDLIKWPYFQDLNLQ